MALIKNMKISKKFLACGLAIGVIFASYATPAFAERKAFSFAVHPDAASGVGFSAGNVKDDNDDFARVVTQSGNIASNDNFYYAVFDYPFDDSSNRVTGYKRVESNNSTVDISYRSAANVTRGDKLYLQADTDTYRVEVEGYWYS